MQTAGTARSLRRSGRLADQEKAAEKAEPDLFRKHAGVKRPADKQRRLPAMAVRVRGNTTRLLGRDGVLQQVAPQVTLISASIVVAHLSCA